MNPLVYIAVSSLVGGGLVYFIQSRIRVKEAKDMAGIHAEATSQQTPFELLRQQITTKDAQIAMKEQQSFEFVQSQMARNDATTKAILELAEQIRIQTGNLKDLGQSLATHRQESSARGGKVYDAIGKVNERLAGLEAGVKNTLEVAQGAAEVAAEAAARLAREAKS